MTGRRRWMTWLMCAAAVVILLGCSLSRIGLNVVETGELQSDSVTIESENAESVRVQIRMGAGELNIDRGGDELMVADFAYNVESWEPVVTYEVAEGEGRLTVRQPNTDQVSVGSNIRNAWDLRFGDQVPLDMRIESGAGDQNVDLAGLRITRLDMQLGAGNSEVLLSDNAELERIEFSTGAGRLSVDMRGSWDQSVDVNIQGGVGSTSLRLPATVGVRVEATRGLGDVSTRGLVRQDGAWVNEAYGTSDVTIDIRIQAGIGEINLIVEE